ncbi:MAG: GTPase HflX [Clostridia bacterium]|nr:GTPase HflX [Clostridia bacterium]
MTQQPNETPQRVLVLAADTGEYDMAYSLQEMRELVRTAGGEVVGELVQKLEKPDSVTWLGKGKLAEAELYCHNLDVEVVVCDGELTATQRRAMEDILDRRVVDRTALILDIFALGAKTYEGKLQVALAQLKYSMANLTGQGEALSRLGGGIGTRGPGESKLESDRRHIRRRIHALEEQLKSLSARRERRRDRRKKDGITTVALVGYTNAGKSTLLNALTNAGVLAENKLFATLDPTSRALKLPDGREVMLIDTVGFLSRLPHLLVEAFKSTLEEAVSADVLLLVCDAADPAVEEQRQTALDLLNELGARNKPVVTVYNKCDIAESYLLPVSRDTVKISALNGTGIPMLLETLADHLPEGCVILRLLIPYDKAGLAAKMHADAEVLEEAYAEDGIRMRVLLSRRLIGLVEAYVEEISP